MTHRYDDLRSGTSMLRGEVAAAPLNVLAGCPHGNRIEITVADNPVLVVDEHGAEWLSRTLRKVLDESREAEVRHEVVGGDDR